MYGSFTNKCFLSEVIDGAQSVKTKTGRKEINVCGFRQAAGQKESSECGAGEGPVSGCSGAEGSPLPVSLAPTGVGHGSPPAKPPHAAGNHFLCHQRGKQWEERVRWAPQETTLPLTYSHFLSPLSPPYLITTLVCWLVSQFLFPSLIRPFFTLPQRPR